MCRFLLYLGPTLSMADCVIKPEHSLLKQSVDSHEGNEPFNGDGYGFAWFVPKFGESPALFKSIKPAWNDRNLHHVARVSESECILAHVRAASPGSRVMRANCHPFVERKYAFMHNGTVSGFNRFRQEMLCGLSTEAFATVVGTTDSEHMFGFFLDALDRTRQTDPLEQMVEALSVVIEYITKQTRAVEADGPTSLNLAVADGRRAVVSRYVTGDRGGARTLYYASGSRYVCDATGCHCAADDPEGNSVIVASEPITEEGIWEAVPPNHFVTIDEERVARLRPIEVRP